MIAAKAEHYGDEGDDEGRLVGLAWGRAVGLDGCSRSDDDGRDGEKPGDNKLGLSLNGREPGVLLGAEISRLGEELV